MLFLRGPFLRGPFLDSGTQLGDTRMQAETDTSASFVTSTAWDETLEEDNSPIAYFAVIEPGVLSDRS